MERTYCHLCGTKLIKRAEQQWKCEGCGQSIYGNPKPAAGIVFIDKDQRAVICVRGREPFKGKLDFIGGFLDVGETLEESVYREVEEEAGLSKTDYSEPRYVGTYSDVYPFGHETYTNVIAVFVSYLHNDNLEAKDDVGEIIRVTLDDIKAEDFSRRSQYDLLVKILNDLDEKAHNS